MTGKLLSFTPRGHAVRVERVDAVHPTITWRPTWRDWAVCIGLIAINVAVCGLVLLGACDAVAWVTA